MIRFAFLTLLTTLIVLFSGAAGRSPAEVFGHLPYYGPSQQAQPYALGGDRTVHDVLAGSSFTYGGDRF